MRLTSVVVAAMTMAVAGFAYAQDDYESQWEAQEAGERAREAAEDEGATPEEQDEAERAGAEDGRARCAAGHC